MKKTIHTWGYRTYFSLSGIVFAQIAVYNALSTKVSLFLIGSCLLVVAVLLDNYSNICVNCKRR